MTDITDQEKRVLREWADENQLRDEETHLAARYILATVDAPAPTLAEELAHIAEYWETWHTDTINEEFTAATTRAERMERDLAEARAEVGRLTEERDRIANGRSITYAEVDGKPVDLDTPRPADVKPGEAWIVECRGERRTAVKDNDQKNVPWNTVNADGWCLPEDNEDITLIAHLVPAPRVITNPDDLEQLRTRSMVLDGAGRVCTKNSPGLFSRSDLGLTIITTEQCFGHGPVTVLWEPATP